MNKVLLVGRIVRDHELKTTQSGKSVVNFSLAVDRRFKNKDGEKEADFINCRAWGKTAELLAQYTGKGSQIGAEGRIQVRSYDAVDGNKRWITEVVVDVIEFLGGKKDGQNNQQNQSPPSNNFDEDFHLMAEDDTEVPF